MSAKKARWLPIKEILFTYLAISKIMYWFNTIVAMNQSDLGNVGEAVLMRFLNQDLMLIISVMAFFVLNQLIELKKSKYSTVLEYVVFYAIGYVVLVGIVFVYNLIMILIFSAQYFSLGEFVRGFISFMPSFTLGYLVVAAALEIKLYFKKKVKPAYVLSVQSTGDTLAMLKALLDDGVLTQEEFDCKKEKLLLRDGA